MKCAGESLIERFANALEDEEDKREKAEGIADYKGRLLCPSDNFNLSVKSKRDKIAAKLEEDKKAKAIEDEKKLNRSLGQDSMSSQSETEYQDDNYRNQNPLQVVP
eukprot:CAMPEP_0116887872 /NCGR_PEP_ID=MMETSP0463-20121206/22576_1 /TAXON_ID=181622 /ORGANISM="Strombidinopsis sp, Strain SopsisLIS2011" /LENGTH=105 /DNA_ID=CAMNT_0004551435 /DNA_START=510 /DNA_END=828 /DNA_ORIENTATION=-